MTNEINVRVLFDVLTIQPQIVPEEQGTSLAHSEEILKGTNKQKSKLLMDEIKALKGRKLVTYNIKLPDEDKRGKKAHEAEEEQVEERELSKAERKKKKKEAASASLEEKEKEKAKLEKNLVVGDFDMSDQTITTMSEMVLLEKWKNIFKKGATGEIIVKQTTNEYDPDTRLIVKNIFGWKIVDRSAKRMTPEVLEDYMTYDPRSGKRLEALKAVRYY